MTSFHEFSSGSGMLEQGHSYEHSIRSSQNKLGQKPNQTKLKNTYNNTDENKLAYEGIGKKQQVHLHFRNDTFHWNIMKLVNQMFWLPDTKAYSSLFFM
jgi:hypothetical protein